MRSQLPPLDGVLVLAGRPPVSDFLRLVKSKAVNGQELDELALAQEWREANVHAQQIETTEAGWADMPTLEPLPHSMADAATTALLDPVVQRCLSFLPYSWALVELDRLIVWQKYVDLAFTDQLKGSLRESPSQQDLIRLAIGRMSGAPPVQVTGSSGNNFSFSSASNDLRVLGTVPLNPAQVQGYNPYGRVLAVLGVFIGYSINLMTAVQMGQRVMLVNGTHRAFALRALGVTHAPCIIRHASSKDDLDLAGLVDARGTAEWHFKTPRPPLLKDFFDKRLVKAIPSHRSRTLLQLELKFVHTRVPVA